MQVGPFLEISDAVQAQVRGSMAQFFEILTAVRTEPRRPEETFRRVLDRTQKIAPCSLLAVQAAKALYFSR